LANLDFAFGLKWYRDPATNNTPTVRYFNNVTSIKGTGQVVGLSSGDLVLSADDSTDWVGVVQQTAAIADTDVPVVMFTPTSEWLIQADATWTPTTELLMKDQLGAIYGTSDTLPTLDANNERSITELVIGDATSSFIVTDWLRTPDNEFGANMIVVVRAHPDRLATGMYATS
jgi:hypothetical protein